MISSIKENIKIIKNHKGKIYIPLMTYNCVRYVQVLKKDLLTQISILPDNEIYVLINEDGLYIERYNG